jgi:hypothetical protein
VGRQSRDLGGRRVVAGLVTAGPAVFVLIKPSLAPFAAFGIRHRRWWGFLFLLAPASLPFGTLWQDWVTALLNSNASTFYSAREALMLAVPVLAWVARSVDREPHVVRVPRLLRRDTLR